MNVILRARTDYNNPVQRTRRFFLPLYVPKVSKCFSSRALIVLIWAPSSCLKLHSVGNFEVDPAIHISKPFYDCYDLWPSWTGFHYSHYSRTICLSTSGPLLMRKSQMDYPVQWFSQCPAGCIWRPSNASSDSPSVQLDAFDALLRHPAGHWENHCTRWSIWDFLISNGPLEDRLQVILELWL